MKEKETRLHDFIILRIKHDSNLRAKLMLASGKAEDTIQRWIKSNVKLTTPLCLKTISEHTGIPMEDILTK